MKDGWSEEDVYGVAERGRALYLQGRLREACVIFEGLVEVDPASAYCRDALGALYLSVGEPERALAQFDELLASFPGHADARARRCETLCRLGRIEEARRDLQRLAAGGAAAHARRLRLIVETAAGARLSLGGKQPEAGSTR